MTSPLEKLLEIERTLKEWMGTDQGKAFRDSVRQDAAHIPTYIHQGTAPEAVAAATLHSIEIAAQYLGEQFGIPLIARGSVKLIGGGVQPPAPLPDENDQPKE